MVSPDRLRPGARGLYFNRARWYDAELGRFTTPDPNATGMPVLASVGFHGSTAFIAPPRADVLAMYGDGMSVYGRALHNPARFGDLTGNSAFGMLGGFMGGLMGRGGSDSRAVATGIGVRAALRKLGIGALVGVHGVLIGGSAIIGLSGHTPAAVHYPSENWEALNGRAAGERAFPEELAVFASDASRVDRVWRVDEDGKIHTPDGVELPNQVPPDWDDNDLEEAEQDLDRSIGRREEEMRDKGTERRTRPSGTNPDGSTDKHSLRIEEERVFRDKVREARRGRH